MQLLTYPFSRLNMPVPNDAISLASSKMTMTLRNNQPQDQLQLALPNYLRIVTTTNNLSVYNFLLDAYIAVAMIEDSCWKDGKLIAVNKHNMLTRISAEIIRRTLFVVNEEVALLIGGGDGMVDVDLSYSAEKRGEYRDMNPYEVLGIKSVDHKVVLSEWRDFFILKAKKKFAEAGLAGLDLEN
jgi:hypothetical protein